MTAPTLHGHGTRACYVRGCKCLPCRAANANYVAGRTRSRLYGRPTTDLVDAAPVREHIQALRDAGMGWKRVAAAAGVARNTVGGLLGYGREPTQRMKPETANAILAVRADLAPGALVDATGTVRRLRALVAVGWSQSRLGDAIGWTSANLTALITGKRARIEHATAQAVRDLYERHWDTPPPDPVRSGQDSTVRARRRAQRLGWEPPLAWDDDTIDDPGALPDLGGQVGGSIGRPALDLDEVDHLAAGGVHISEIARRLGRTVGAIEQARHRARRVAS